MKHLLLTILIILVAASAMATETRVLTMGDNNMILLDEHNIALFPSRVLDYPNIAVAEFNNDVSNDFSKFGIHWQFNKDNPWVLATYLNNDVPLDHPYSPIDLPYRDGFDLSNQRLDMYYGRTMGTSKVGMHLGIRHSSEVHDTESYMDEAAMNVYTIAVGLTPEDNKFDVAVGLELMSWTDKDTYNDGSGAVQVTESEPDGNMGFYAIGRMFRKMNDNTTIIPHAGLRYGSYGAKYYNDDGSEITYTEESKLIALDLGIGMQYTPAKNVLAVVDFGFAFDNITTELLVPGTEASAEMKENRTTLPYIKMGFDAGVFSWMDVRFGATSYWNAETDEDITDVTSKHTYKYANNETYLGLGFHWNQLHIDVHANPEMFLDGFNFLSGADNNMNFRISAVYEMM